MKNTVQTIAITVLLFTIIGCDNLPTDPVSYNDNSSKIAVHSDSEFMSEDNVQPSDNNFTANKNDVPFDSILPCLNLSPEDLANVISCQNYWAPVRSYILNHWKMNLDNLDITTQANFKKLNIKPSDTNYRKVVTEFNTRYKFKKDSINNMMSDSLNRRETIFYKRCVYRSITDEVKKAMFMKWYNNRKLTCEFLKP